MKNYIVPFALGVSVSMALLSRNMRSEGQHPGYQNDDMQFVRTAMEEGIAEVMLANLALEQSGHAAVRKFAKMIVADHQQANNQLKALVKKSNLGKEIKSPSPASQEVLQRLRALSGRDFDHAYAQQTVENHTKSLAVFHRQLEHGNNEQLKDFANKQVTVLKKHLDHARKLQQEFNQR